MVQARIATLLDSGIIEAEAEGLLGNGILIDVLVSALSKSREVFIDSLCESV